MRARCSLSHTLSLLWFLALAACQPSTSGSDVVAIPPASAPLPDPEEYDRETPIQPDTHPVPGVVCSWTRREVSLGSQTYPALAPHADVVYPGADLQGRTLNDGIPAPITAPRSGGSIVMANANGSLRSSEELEEVSLANVTEAINSILRNQEEEFPADLTISISRLRAREEMQLELNANAGFFGLFDLSSNFDWREEFDVSRFLVTLRQNFYTIAFERPPNANEFYAPGTAPSDFEQQVYEGNPACYVSEVTYGRVFYLLVQARSEEAAMSATLSANIELGVFGGGGDGSYRYVEDFHDMTLKAYAYGGEQDAVIAAIEGGLDSLNDFMADLRTANDLLSAKPISYTVRDLATDLVVKNGYSLAYDYANCTFPGECVPSLLSPLGERRDNGCAIDPNPVTWQFSWSAPVCAEKYLLQVFRPQGGLLVDTEVTGTTFTYQSSSGFQDAAGWRWRVAAYAFGEWHPWSEVGAFSLEPFNADCPTGVRLYKDVGYRGAFIDVHEDVPNLQGWSFNDITTSLELLNVRGVVLYEHSNYRGRRVEIGRDTPDLRDLAFNDMMTSLQIIN